MQKKKKKKGVGLCFWYGILKRKNLNCMASYISVLHVAEVMVKCYPDYTSNERQNYLLM